MNNYWHADISTIKHVSRDFCRSIMVSRESVSVDKEHSKQYGDQASITEKIKISACVNGIPYINGTQEMDMHEQITFVK